jgi:hypothetical protein
MSRFRVMWGFLCLFALAGTQAVAQGPVPYSSLDENGVALYPHVRVKDCRNIAPGAVPIIVSVKDPNTCRKACRCCPPQYVLVQVFVPPCPLRKRDVGDRGAKLELDYGKYEIDIKSRDGVITVDYDD